MGPPATPRLLAATAALTPADRALVDLWVHRGLDDTRLSALTGLDAEAVSVRRERIIGVLARELGVPESDVRAALPGAPAGADGRRDVSTTPGSLDSPATVTSTGPHRSPPPPPAGPPPPPAPVPAPGVTPAPVATADTHTTSDQPGPELEVDGGESPAGRCRGRVWAVGLAAVAIAVAAALIVVLSGAHRSSSRPAADRSATTAPSVTSTSATNDPSSTTTSDPPTPTTATAPAGSGALAGLPGGVRDASGQVSLLGHRPHLRLRLTLRGLPAPGAGAHYEAWLYTSVLDSRPLGPVRDGIVETFRLPRGAGRYRFIDISRQPRGAVNHSGESRLRTVNPVHDLRVHPRHPGRVRRRRSLHPASGAHMPHPVDGGRRDAHRHSRRRGAARHSRRRGAHRHSARRGAAGSAAGAHHRRRHRRSGPHRRRHGRGSDSRTRRTR